MGENRLNENRIQQVLEIEKQANTIRDEMIRSAALLPVQAEKEAQAMVEKERAEAQDEANQMLAKAKAEQESADIMSQANEKTLSIETLAKGNFNRAVSYVVARVIGKE
jgi:F0F1-type ATP synthase membrane subunit b/b'